jgi:hypothetical protein
LKGINENNKRRKEGTKSAICWKQISSKFAVIIFTFYSTHGERDFLRLSPRAEKNYCCQPLELLLLLPKMGTKGEAKNGNWQRQKKDVTHAILLGNEWSMTHPSHSPFQLFWPNFRVNFHTIARPMVKFIPPSPKNVIHFQKCHFWMFIFIFVFVPIFSSFLWVIF